MDHSVYDRRRYPIVDVREGYGEWVRTYEDTVLDEMDLRLLARLRTVDWSSARTVLDLACGTGRVGAWLRERSRAPRACTARSRWPTWRAPGWPPRPTISACSRSPTST